MVESRGKKWLVTGLIVAVVLITLGAVACGGSNDASGPEQAVQDLLSAMEAKDIDAFFAVMDPQGLAQMEEMGYAVDQLKDLLEAEMTYQSMKFEGVKLQTELSEDGQTATVTVVEGILTTVEEDGTEYAEDVRDSGAPQTFDVVLQDGKWYLDTANLF